MKWLMLALLAVLPLQWFIIAGPLRLHLLAMVLFGLVVLMTHRGSAYQPVLRVALPFVLANAVLCVVWFATNGYNGMNFRQPIQQLLYLGVFLAVATVVLPRSVPERKGIRRAAAVGRAGRVGVPDPRVVLLDDHQRRQPGWPSSPRQSPAGIRKSSRRSCSRARSQVSGSTRKRCAATSATRCSAPSCSRCACRPRVPPSGLSLPGGSGSSTPLDRTRRWLDRGLHVAVRHDRHRRLATPRAGPVDVGGPAHAARGRGDAPRSRGGLCPVGHRSRERAVDPLHRGHRLLRGPRPPLRGGVSRTSPRTCGRAVSPPLVRARTTSSSTPGCAPASSVASARWWSGCSWSAC